MVGFASLENLPHHSRNGFPYDLSIAVALKPSAIASLQNGPTGEYFTEYKKANEFLSSLGKVVVQLLHHYGYRAKVLEPTSEDFDPDTFSTPLLHKTMATRAGLGWIGKSALLVTQKYGSAVRPTSVLTDCPLPTGIPITHSQCGTCSRRVEVCPGSALSGKVWEITLPREAYFNASLCFQTAKNSANHEHHLWNLHPRLSLDTDISCATKKGNIEQDQNRGKSSNQIDRTYNSGLVRRDKFRSLAFTPSRRLLYTLWGKQSVNILKIMAPIPSLPWAKKTVLSLDSLAHIGKFLKTESLSSAHWLHCHRTW